MDQEILQLLRSLSHRGLKGLDVQHKRMLLFMEETCQQARKQIRIAII